MEGTYHRQRSGEGSCIHWLQEHKKEVVLTVVALVAIGAVVVGLLAVLANTTSFSGAGSIGQMGLPGGAAASAIGLLVLVAIASYYIYRRSNCSKSQTTDSETTRKRRSHDSDDEREAKRSKNSSDEESSFSTPRVSKRTIQGLNKRLYGLPHRKEPAPKSQRGKEHSTPIDLGKKGTHTPSPVTVRKEQPLAATPLLRQGRPGPSVTKKGEVPSSVKQELRYEWPIRGKGFSISILPMTARAQKTARPQEAAAEFCFQEAARELGIKDPLERLNQLYNDDKKKLEVNLFIYEAHLEQEVNSLKMSFKLLLMTDQELLSLRIEEINQYHNKALLSLLHLRLGRIDQKGEIEDKPEAPWKDSKEMTLGEYRQCNPSSLPQPLLSVLTPLQIEQLLLHPTPKDFFATQLPLESNSIERTQYILGQLGVDAIVLHIDHLPNEYFRLLSIEQFKDKDFPWATVAQSQAKMDVIFSMGSSDERERTQAILNSLDFEIITILIERRLLEHHQLRLLSQKKCLEDGFPWKAVADEGMVQEVLPVERVQDREKSKEILNGIRMHNVAIIITGLDDQRLKMLEPERLKDKEFPWHLVNDAHKLAILLPVGTSKEREQTEAVLDCIEVDHFNLISGNLSGEQLHLRDPSKLAWDSFDWEPVIKSQKKADALFSMKDSDSRERTAAILGKLTPFKIGRLMDVLSGDCLQLVTVPQFTSSLFPWDKLVEQKKLLHVLSMRSQEHREKTKEILNGIDMVDMKTILLHLDEDRLQMLKPKTLQKEDFPWDIVAQFLQVKFDAWLPTKSRSDKEFTKPLVQSIHISQIKRLDGLLTFEHRMLLKPEQREALKS